MRVRPQRASCGGSKTDAGAEMIAGLAPPEETRPAIRETSRNHPCLRRGGFREEQKNQAQAGEAARGCIAIEWHRQGAAGSGKAPERGSRSDRHSAGDSD